jgi:hypothetical protein
MIRGVLRCGLKPRTAAAAARRRSGAQVVGRLIEW